MKKSVYKPGDEFRLMAEAMPNIVWITSPDGYNLYFNSRWYDYTGQTLEESMGDGWNAPFHPEDKEMAWQAWNNALQAGSEYSIEARLCRHDGQYSWWLIRGLPVVDGQQQVQRWIGTCTDIDDIKKTEKQLRMSETRLVNAQRVTRVGSWETDLSTFEVIWTAETYHIFEIDPATFKASHQAFLDFVHPDDKQLVDDAFLRSFDLPGNHKVDHRIISNKGNVKVVEERWHIERDHEGHPVRAVGTCQDITERKQIEDQLNREKTRAEQAMKTRTEFLLSMSHEIRTPLNSVIGLADVLAETSLDEEQQSMVKTIQKSGNFLLLLINDILDLSRLESGKVTPDLSEFDFIKMLDDIISSLQITAAAKDITIVSKASALMPEHIVTDEVRLRQILFNLIGNAIKFTDSGTVTVSARIKNGRLNVSVEDTGRGIPVEKQEFLFQQFSQFDPSVSGRLGGSGLGLSISQKLVELLGGRILFNSTPGEGSVFSFEIPVKAGHHVENEKMPDRILICDDNDANLMVAGLMLKKLGYSYDTALNGTEAFERVKENPYRFILMDIEMPAMSGLEATRLIREYERTSGASPGQIYAYTAHIGRDAEVVECGMDGILSKPVTLDAMREILGKIFAG